METKGSGASLLDLSGTEAFDFADKVPDIAELAVHRGKADIGDLVHFFQGIHDLFANGGSRNFPPIFLLQLLHDFINGFFNDFGADRPFFACFLEAKDKFSAIKGFVTSIPFDGPKIFPLNLFVRCESIVAGETLATTPNNGSVFPGPGIDYFIFFDIAFWAFHTTPCVAPKLQVGGVGSIKF